MKKKTKFRQHIIDLSSKELRGEYMIKCAASIGVEDAKFNKGLAKNLGLTEDSFNVIYKRYQKYPKLKQVYWDQYAQALRRSLTYQPKMEWK